MSWGFKLSEEQKQFIDQNRGRMKDKDIAAELNISRYHVSIYVNKKRTYRDEYAGRNGLFQVELGPEKTWLI